MIILDMEESLQTTFFIYSLTPTSKAFILLHIIFRMAKVFVLVFLHSQCFCGQNDPDTDSLCSICRRYSLQVIGIISQLAMCNLAIYRMYIYLKTSTKESHKGLSAVKTEKIAIKKLLCVYGHKKKYGKFLIRVVVLFLKTTTF